MGRPVDVAPGCRDGHHPFAPIGNVEELPFSGHWGRARRRPSAHPAAQLRITRISASCLSCGFPHQEKDGLLTGHPEAAWRSAVIDRLPVMARRAGLDPAQWPEGRAPEDPDGDDVGPARAAAGQREARDGVTSPGPGPGSRPTHAASTSTAGTLVLHRMLTIKRPHGDPQHQPTPHWGVVLRGQHTRRNHLRTLAHVARKGRNPFAAPGHPKCRGDARGGAGIPAGMHGAYR